MEFVLTVDHPEYSSPRPGECYCYRRGELVLSNVRRLVWSGQGAPPAMDASGELDYGNIDSFDSDEAGFRLCGDWGHMDVLADGVEVRFTDTDP